MTVVQDLAKTLVEAARGQSGRQLEQVVEQFFASLKETNKLSLAKPIIKAVAKEEVKEKNKGLRLIAAQDLSEGLVKKIAKIFTIAPEEVSLKKDAKLLGGIVIEYNDLVYDLSIKNQIHLLKTHLIS